MTKLLRGAALLFRIFGMKATSSIYNWRADAQSGAADLRDTFADLADLFFGMAVGVGGMRTQLCGRDLYNLIWGHGQLLR